MYLSTPAHSVCGGRCPGGQVGIPHQKVDHQKLIPNASNLPGVFAIILGHYGEGLGVWGEGSVLDPLLAGKSVRGGQLRPQMGVFLKC